MKRVFLFCILACIISGSISAQSNGYGSYGVRTKMYGTWAYPTTPSAYTSGDSLRIVYWKQLKDSCAALHARILALSSGFGMTNPMTTTGDMIYSSSGSTPARLGIGTAAQRIVVSSGVPIWRDTAAVFIQHLRTNGLNGDTLNVMSGVDGQAASSLSNCSSASAQNFLWTRTGDIISVDGFFTVAITAPGATSLEYPLPFPSQVTDPRSSGFGKANADIVDINGATDIQKVHLSWTATSLTTLIVRIHYQYRVK